MIRRPRAIAVALAAGLAWAAPAWADGGPRHGLSTFGELKYPPGFRHFDYVNPDAPKGGELRAWDIDTFDTLNPLTLKGVPPQGLDLVFESLMVRAMDEPDALYGLLAESVELGPGRAWAAFNLNGAARWHDGTPVTADDVVFTLDRVMREGHPRFRLLYADVESVAAEGPRRAVFRFKPGESRRDLPLRVAELPIMSRAWFAGRDFTRTTLEPPLASGPYRIERVEPGRSVTYRRVADHWGRDLPVNRGRYNFDVVKVEFFRDRDIAFQALFAGAYDFRVEITARDWATGYDGKPPVEKGWIRREVLRDETPSGVQAFFLNTRRDRFQDRRVRQALNLAFDYDWMNKNLFYGLYKRTRSMFENSDLAASGLPDAAELALLAPWRDRLPAELFAREFQPDESASAGRRDALRAAQALLAEAGWVVREGRLVSAATGAPFTIEFLLFEQSFTRVVNPYIRNLERLGIQPSIRLVDITTFENRMKEFDYDVIIRRFTQPLTPGVEQRNYWTSGAAGVIGSFNFSGIREPAVDALVEKIVAADSRAALTAATRALDRVLMWGYYTVPQWHSGTFRLAYWDKFGRPALKPRFDLGLVDTWWIDPEKQRRLPEQPQSPRG